MFVHVAFLKRTTDLLQGSVYRGSLIGNFRFDSKQPFAWPRKVPYPTYKYSTYGTSLGAAASNPNASPRGASTQESSGPLWMES